MTDRSQYPDSNPTPWPYPGSVHRALGNPDQRNDQEMAAAQAGMGAGKVPIPVSPLNATLGNLREVQEMCTDLGIQLGHRVDTLLGPVPATNAEQRPSGESSATAVLDEVARLTGLLRADLQRIAGHVQRLAQAGF